MTMNDPQAIESDRSESSPPHIRDIKTQLYSLDYAASNPWPWAFGICLISAFALWHVATNVFLNEPGLWQNAIHFAGFAFLGAVTTRSWGRGGQSNKSLLINLIFGILIAASALWIAGAENGLYERTLAKTGLSWQFGYLDWIAGFIHFWRHRTHSAADGMDYSDTRYIVPVVYFVSGQAHAWCF